jgi:hypothetical protein
MGVNITRERAAIRTVEGEVGQAEREMDDNVRVERTQRRTTEGKAGE